MNIDVATRTIGSILFLIFLGYSSRKIGFLKQGDERVFSAYIYYFALPSLFIINLTEVDFTFERLRFIFAGQIPVILIIAVYVIAYMILKFSRETLYLLIVSTVFGSLAFFGLPFVILAFPGELILATLAVASISIVAVPISIGVLELHQIGESALTKTARHIARKLSKNPLIISIVLGFILSLLKVEIPSPLKIALEMLGGTTATVAIFMLGVFFYGRKYVNISHGLQLSLLRAIVLPLIALFVASWLNLTMSEKAIIIIMHGCPVAVSNIVLSERYNFYKETMASLILISSIAAGIYLNLWLFLLGY
jgi:predicted permease